MIGRSKEAGSAYGKRSFRLYRLKENGSDR